MVFFGLFSVALPPWNRFSNAFFRSSFPLPPPPGNFSADALALPTPQIFSSSQFSAYFNFYNVTYCDFYIAYWLQLISMQTKLSEIDQSSEESQVFLYEKGVPSK